MTNLSNKFAASGLKVIDNEMTTGESFSPVTEDTTTNIQTQGGYWYRRGNMMIVQASLEFSGVNTQGAVKLAIPNGLSVDSSKFPTGFGTGGEDRFAIGKGHFFDTNNADYYNGNVVYDKSLDIIYITVQGDNLISTSSNTPVAVADGDAISWHFEVPIAEWAGAITVANNRVEYAYNTESVANTNDTTSFAYGPEGAAILSHTAQTELRVQFKTPIQSSDKVELQLDINGTGNWLPLNNTIIDDGFAIGVSPNIRQGSTFYGIALQQHSTTEVDVIFRQYSDVGSGVFGAAGAAWSGAAGVGARWRVVKSSNPLGIGAGLATDTQPGAIPSYKDSGEGDLGTIGGWATVDSKKYRWVKVGNVVNFYFRVESATASSSVTSLNFVLTNTDAPAPADLSNQGTVEYYGSFQHARHIAVATDPTIPCWGAVYKDGSSNYTAYGFTSSAQATKLWTGVITYLTDV